MKADSGNKFDTSKVNRVLAYIVDWSDGDLSLLIDRLLQEKAKRPGAKNTDTIQT